MARAMTKNKCPVTDKGCPPVITLVSDLKWVKWGVLFLVTVIVGGWLKWAVVNSLTVTEATATTEIEEDR